MTTFLQMHLLTSYPPSNLNRDDLGRPKTAVMGGTNRLRISSQSLKRAWRKSEIFASHVAPTHIGTRTKEMGKKVFEDLCAKGIEESLAKEWAGSIAGVFGKRKSKPSKKDPHSDLEIEQLAHFTPFEVEAIETLVQKLADMGHAPSEQDLILLRKEHTAVDVALFGRMLAAAPAYNTEAAAQVAHAITVHATAVEEDFFTAVDDLNRGDEDRGSGHMGETEFGSGVFYVYVCVDCDSLVKNLSGHAELAGQGVAGLLEAAAKVSPTGKQNSFASRAYASYVLVEKGAQQPRSLAVSFLKPVTGDDFLAAAIRRLEETRSRIDTTYGKCWDQCAVINANQGSGSFAEILQFVREAVS